jgi:hypothetical protein
MTVIQSVTAKNLRNCTAGGNSAEKQIFVGRNHLAEEGIYE